MNCLPQLITKLPIAIVKEINTIVAIKGETAFLNRFTIKNFTKKLIKMILYKKVVIKYL